MGATRRFRYAEWLSKSYFSFLKGTSSPGDLLRYASSLEYDSICLNDFDGVYGLARAHVEHKQIHADTLAELRLNHGAEIHLIQDHDLPVMQQATIVLNVLNFEGYKNLNAILTHAHKHTKDQAFISVEDLCYMPLDGIFAIIPMRGGLTYFIHNKPSLQKIQAALGDALYVAITKTYQRHLDASITTAFDFAKTHHLKTLICQDVFMHHTSMKSYHDMITAIDQNLVIQDAGPHLFANGERSLHDLHWLQKAYGQFAHYTSMLKNSEELLEKSSFSLAEIKYQYPKEMIPDGLSAQQYLEKLTWEGAKKRFDGRVSPKVADILAKELDLIEDLGFADYFITVWDIVRWAREQNILCQGRGSAANSAVCYCLGVTSCDPALFDLLFERFMSKERGDPPDIDVDFEHERREEVIQYIYRRYGRARASMVANIITFKRKGSIRAVGKALGVPETVLKKASNVISTVNFRSESTQDILSYVKKQVSASLLPEGFSWNIWVYFAQKLLGSPRHMGLHSGGFVITDQSIHHLVAQEPATMENRTVIQWAKDDIEELGFFKIDCLALGMLTAMRKAFQLIADKYKTDLNLYNLPLDDQPTYKMIQKADTVGVFQIESRAQMSMLPRLKPKCFYDLVIEVAIIRPGPIQGKVIHPYLRRRDGVEPVTFPHPKVKNILAKTLGVIIFQEQMMRMSMELGDFTPGEADQLRKHIGSWNSKKFNRNLEPYMKKLMRGLQRHGVDQKFIEGMLEQMKGFAHYGFPESHAISFAFIAYASSYLKCHYPAAFYTSVMNSQPMGFYSPHALIQAAKHDGVEVRPITVNQSHWDHTLESIEQREGRPARYAIRLGFRLISGLSQKAMDKLVVSREKSGPWISFQSFVQDNHLNKDDYSALAAANAFACLNITRSNALWNAQAVPYKPLVDTKDREIQWPQRTTFEETQIDFHATGTSLSTHPAEIIKKSEWPYDIPTSKINLAKELEKEKANLMVFAFGMVLAKQAPPSAKGMVFYTLEDETGFINLAFAPDIYQKFFQTLEQSGFLLIQGKLQKAGSYHSILVKNAINNQNIEKLQNDESNLRSSTSNNIVSIHSPRQYY